MSVNSQNEVSKMKYTLKLGCRGRFIVSEKITFSKMVV